MNNKKLFDYIDKYGGDSNNFIKINNLDSMLDFESSDVKDNTEDYTISLLDKILSNGSTNDNDVLSDSSGGFLHALPVLFAVGKRIPGKAIQGALTSAMAGVIKNVNTEKNVQIANVQTDKKSKN